MIIKISVGARKFGYIIWNKKTGSNLVKALKGRKKVRVFLNGFDLGEKNVDYKYSRISLGYRFTRSLPEDHNAYSIKIDGIRMEVKTFHDNV